MTTTEKILPVATIILGLITVVLSQSEAVWVAIPATLFIMSLFDKLLRKWTIPVAALGLILLFSPIRPFSTFSQKIFLHDTSGSVRLLQWREARAFLHDHLIFGAGLSGYPIAIKPYHPETYIEIFQYPHDIFLNIWVELGLLGLVAFFLLGISVVRTAAMNPGATGIVFAALLVMSIHGLVDVPYFKNDLALLTWFFLAVIFATTHADSKVR